MNTSERRWYFSTPSSRAQFDYRCKREPGQLASKMRFLSAQWTWDAAGLRAWLRHATHANAMAKKLAAGLRELPGLKILVEPAGR